MKKLLDASSFSMILMIILWSLPIENLVGQCSVKINDGINTVNACANSQITLTASYTGVPASTPVSFLWWKSLVHDKKLI